MGNASIAWQGDWDAWVDEWLDGKRSGEYGGTYFDHVKKWWHLSRLHPQRVLIVYYEDLKADLAQNVERIASFLGRGVASDELHDIVAQCSFQEMRAKYSVPDDVRDRINPIHFRRGEVGTWREVLSVAQAAAVDAATRRFLGDEVAQGLRILDVDSEL